MCACVYVSMCGCVGVTYSNYTWPKLHSLISSVQWVCRVNCKTVVISGYMLHNFIGLKNWSMKPLSYKLISKDLCLCVCACVCVLWWRYVHCNGIPSCFIGFVLMCVLWWYVYSVLHLVSFPWFQVRGWIQWSMILRRSTRRVLTPRPSLDWSRMSDPRLTPPSWARLPKLTHGCWLR